MPQRVPGPWAKPQQSNFRVRPCVADRIVHRRDRVRTDVSLHAVALGAGRRALSQQPPLRREAMRNQRSQDPRRAWPTRPYIPMARGFVYLVAVIDWFTRKVLAWRHSNTLTSDFLRRGCTGGDRQVRRAADLQHRSGRAGQFTSAEFIGSSACSSSTRSASASSDDGSRPKSRGECSGFSTSAVGRGICAAQSTQKLQARI